MVTYRIMEYIEYRCQGFKLGNVIINSLFYADDGLILEESEERMEETIDVVRMVSKEYGLEVNDSKSKIINFNTSGSREEIKGIEIVKCIKYLGILISNEKDIYSEQRKEMLY